MISIIIILIIAISITAIFSYTMLTFNNNLSLLNDAKTNENELKIINKILITKAIAINGKENYSLPLGQNINGVNTFPSKIGLPLKNKKGFQYIYCPYSSNETTSSSKIIDVKDDLTSYKVNIKTINGVDYVNGSDAPVSFANAPEISAIIISKNKDNKISCSDIKFSEDESTFYTKNAKVLVINKNQLKNYAYLSDLSSKTQLLDLTNSNFETYLNIIKNDTSNKSYILNLKEDIYLNKEFKIERNILKKAKIKINENNFSIYGSNELYFKNIMLEITGENTPSRPLKELVSINLNKVDLNLKTSKIGGIKSIDSKIDINNSIISNNSDSIEFKNSKITIRGIVSFYQEKKASNENAIKLINSKIIIENDSKMNFGFYNENPKDFLKLINSSLILYGDIIQLDTIKYPSEIIYIDSQSKLKLLGGKISLSGKMTKGTRSFPIKSEGLIYSGKQDNASEIILRTRDLNLLGIINVFNGASLELSNINIGKNGIVGKATIVEQNKNGSLKGLYKITGSDNVNIYASTKCWNGNMFTNTDLSNAINNSKTDKPNNFSNWNCILKK